MPLIYGIYSAGARTTCCFFVSWSVVSCKIKGLKLMFLSLFKITLLSRCSAVSNTTHNIAYQLQSVLKCVCWRTCCAEGGYLTESWKSCYDSVHHTVWIAVSVLCCPQKLVKETNMFSFVSDQENDGEHTWDSVSTPSPFAHFLFCCRFI